MGSAVTDVDLKSFTLKSSRDQAPCWSSSTNSSLHSKFYLRKGKKKVQYARDMEVQNSNGCAVTAGQTVGLQAKKTKIVDWTDGYYFDSYAHHQIHETMLKDRVRTLTYRDAICYNKHLFQGRVVLDVGCGTGILSMFAAKAGAAKVIGIDMSDIAKYARQIVRDNNLDSIITIIQGKIEETELPDGIEKVDIIISEWMGYCLLLESMLDTVLYARDKWLKFNGMIFPDKVSLWIAGIHIPNKTANKDLWSDFEGFDMSPISHNLFHKGHVCHVNANQVMTSHYELLEFDLNTVYKEELSFQVPYSLEVQNQYSIDALVTFFTVNFSRCLKQTGFSTSPESPETHWHHTVFYLNQRAHARKGETVKGKLRLNKNPLNHRGLDISIDFHFDGALNSLHESNRYVLM